MDKQKFSVGQPIIFLGEDKRLDKKTIYIVEKYCTSCPEFCGFIHLKNITKLGTFHQDKFTAAIINENPEDWL